MNLWETVKASLGANHWYDYVGQETWSLGEIVIFEHKNDDGSFEVNWANARRSLKTGELEICAQALTCRKDSSPDERKRVAAIHAKSAVLSNYEAETGIILN